MPAERWQELRGMAEHPSVHLSPTITRSEDVCDPPGLDLQRQPDRIPGRADPHQPLEPPRVGEPEQEERNREGREHQKVSRAPAAAGELNGKWRETRLVIPAAE